MIPVLTTLLLAGIPGATVTLPLEAEARGREVELGEVAEIVSSDPVLLRGLSELGLGYTPAPGYSRVLSAARIAEEIRRALPGVEVALEGYSACRVRPEVERVPEAAIRAAAETEMMRLTAGRDVHFEPASEIRGVDVPARASSFVLRARATAKELHGSTVSIPVQVLVEDELYRTVWTSWRVEQYRTVPVLTREVRAGEVIAPELLERRRVPVHGAAAAKPLVADLVAGSVAAHDLSAGSVVTGLDVHRPVAVETGRSVQLEVRKGAITARVAAMARESGAIGDRIRVVAANGGRELTATIVARDLVRVDLGGGR